MEFSPLTGALGADVRGVDLTRPLTAADAAAIHEGLLEHQVLFFRDQKVMTVDQHMALARRFGEPEPTPFRPRSADVPIDLLIMDQEHGTASARLHADNTFRPHPPIGAILQAHVLPERGGDTVFASMYAAYEALSPRMRDYLDGLEAYHSLAQMASRLSRHDCVTSNPRLLVGQILPFSSKPICG